MDPGGLIWDINRMENKIMKKNKDFKLKKHALVHTYKTEKELNEYMDRHHGTEKFLIYMGAALCWNMIAHWQEEGHQE